jgi:hypothetical protein
MAFFYLSFLLFGFFTRSSARPITVSNTTCYCNLTTLLLVFLYVCLLEWFIFSRSIAFIYLTNCFRFPLVSSHLLTGHLSTLSALLFRIYLPFFSLLHWNIRWSTVCMPCLHGHSGLPINLIDVSIIEYYHCQFVIIFPKFQQFYCTFS